MVERRQRVSSVPRRQRAEQTPFPTRRRYKQARKGRKGAPKNAFEEGNKRGRGRPPGVPNKMPTSVKQAIIDAANILGEDGEGKNGMTGYFVKVLRADIALGTRLLERIIPLQVSGPNGGPIPVFNIPPELLKGLTDPQLVLLEAILKQLGGMAPKVIEHDSIAASDYAKEIGYVEESTTSH